MAIVLLLIVFTGFSRTLFMRPLFQVPPIPWYLYVHGGVLTCWFVFFVVQTNLVASRRIDLHRRLGVAGAILAVAVVGISLFAVLDQPHRFGTGHLPAPYLVVLDALWAGIALLVFFPIAVTAALLLRARPETHRRLMLLASIAMIGPAVGRLGPFVHSWTGLAEIPFNLLFLLGLPLTLVVHDLRAKRRLHSATVWGVTAYLLVAVFAGHAIAPTELGRAVFSALE
jgi:hypothetical protein